MLDKIFQRFTETNHRIPQAYVTVRPKPQKGQSTSAKDISTLISKYLISLTLTDNRGFEADQLDITLSDEEGTFALPGRGAILSLGLGWKHSPLVFKGEYTVDEVEHSGSPDIITIRARSADLRGTLMERHERSFHQTTIGKIVEQIASENSLNPFVSLTYYQQAISHLDQTNESSINLLSRLAKEHDAIATVKNGRLLFIQAGQAQTASGKPLPKTIIERQSGDSHRFAIAENNNYKAVKAYWHNLDNGKRGEVTIDEHSQITRQHKLTKKGKQSKNTKIVVKQTEPVESHSDNIKTLRHTYATKSAALKACQREYERLQRGVATLSLTLAEGNPELMPELPVTVKGFKAEIDATQWLITQVTHSISADSGYITSLEMELLVNEK